ncbi:MAG: MtrAB system histidine kinase MtrB [Streptosporangiaceae bacterium]
MAGAAGSGAGPRRAAVLTAQAARRLRRTARALLRRSRVRWRGSLQLRVVTTTLVVSAIVVAVLGFFLMQQIAAGLLQSKVRSAAGQAGEGLEIVQSQQRVYASLGSATSNVMFSLATELAARGGSGNYYGVAVLLPPSKQGKPVFTQGAAVNIVSGEIPTALVAKVERARSSSDPTMQYQPAVLSYGAPQASTPTAGLVFGAPFGNYYQLYYFFPLTAEQQELAGVQHTLLLVGFALVFLLAGIAWLVTRWVVVPVRQAAQATHRLATGHLDDRMPVRGTDELAALARSFNGMAASLQDKMTELEDLSRVQRQFVSDVSHELRTPLTTIRIAADVLFGSRDGLDPAVARSAELLQSQLERFESLLSDLLEISRYDAHAATLDAELVDVCNVVRNSADVAQQLAERRGTSIEFRLPAEPCMAEIDRRRVARILRNLLVNAVEHGENRDTVVTVAVDSTAVAVAVRDYGIGLAPGHERQVFDRFWRADPARARSTGGTGLGLSIALEDARLHGGWLEAWGQPGRGSVFRLTLPRTAGGTLVGSPLALLPDDTDLGTVSAALAAVAGPDGGPAAPVSGGGPAAPADDAADRPGAGGVPPDGGDVIPAPGSPARAAAQAQARG